MTQTEHNPDQAPRFSVLGDYDAHPGSSFDWRVDIIFDLEANCVRIVDRWGDATPAREWNGVDIRLATAKGSTFASVTPVVEFLSCDRAQALLADLAEGHEVEWDGSNHVGRLTQDALDARERLQNDLQELFADLPCYFTAEEWFNPSPNAELTGSESEEDLQARATAEVARALPDYHLQAADVLRYLADRRNELAND